MRVLLIMKLVLKLIAVIFILTVLLGTGFVIWGQEFERIFSQKECIAWFKQIKPEAWMIGIGLLVGDLFLPIPAPGIMAALGDVYGLWVGVLISIAGSVIAGVIGYSFAWLFGQKGMRLLASEKEITKFRNIFEIWGGPALIITRIIPIMPEVITILSGFTRMRLSLFLAALLLGTIPTCFLFVWLGSISAPNHGYIIILTVMLSLAGWPVCLRMMYKKKRSAKPLRKKSGKSRKKT